MGRHRKNKRSKNRSSTKSRFTPIKVKPLSELLTDKSVYEFERSITIVVIIIVLSLTLLLPIVILYKRKERKDADKQKPTDINNTLVNNETINQTGGASNTPSPIQAIINERISNTAADILTSISDNVKNNIAPPVIYQ